MKKYLIVVNVFERVADDTNPHVDQVRRGHFEDLLGELLPVLVDLLHTSTLMGASLWNAGTNRLFNTNLHGQMSDDGSLMTLQRLQRNLGNLTLGFAHEHLTGSGQHLLVLALDFHLKIYTYA